MLYNLTLGYLQNSDIRQTIPRIEEMLELASEHELAKTQITRCHTNLDDSGLGEIFNNTNRIQEPITHYPTGNDMRRIRLTFDEAPTDKLVVGIPKAGDTAIPNT
jgi:hypothetical protein